MNDDCVIEIEDDSSGDTYFYEFEVDDVLPTLFELEQLIDGLTFGGFQ